MTRKKKQQQQPTAKVASPKDNSIKVVGGNPPGDVYVGKPRKVMANMSNSYFSNARGTMLGSGGNIYSPELSTDFLELPQSPNDKKTWYRFFYDNDPFVAQAIDLHTEIPLSKTRIQDPKVSKDTNLSKRATRFCERWVDDIDLDSVFEKIGHEYNLIGQVVIWVEDTNPIMPQHIMREEVAVLNPDGSFHQEWVLKADAIEQADAWLKRHYQGWTRIRCLPPEQIKIEAHPFTDAYVVRLTPSDSTKAIVAKARSGDLAAREIVSQMPEDIVLAIEEGNDIPLNTDPSKGSFVYVMSRKRSDYETEGRSLLQRVLRPLLFRDKLRQAATSIASRHMTPMRIVSIENGSEVDVEIMREQIDMALMDPDYSIVANFPIEWQEMGSDARLPDWSWAWEMTDRQMYAGLGVTESLLSGESSYSGDKINLEVVNIRHGLFRRHLQTFVEKFLFRPMMARMGFVEVDDDGRDRILTPRLSFTRLGLRDNSEVFDTLFQLYQKGSLDVGTIMELLGLDVDVVSERLNADKFTLRDSQFNEVLRGIYTDVAGKLVESGDITETIAKNLGVTLKPPEEGGGDEMDMGRFASKKPSDRLVRDISLALLAKIALTMDPSLLDKAGGSA